MFFGMDWLFIINNLMFVYLKILSIVLFLICYGFEYDYGYDYEYDCY